MKGSYLTGQAGANIKSGINQMAFGIYGTNGTKGTNKMPPVPQMPLVPSAKQ
jgi:hypothetical protein